MKKTVEEGGTSNFQERSGENSMCLSKHGLFKTWSVCLWTNCICESIYRLKHSGREYTE